MANAKLRNSPRRITEEDKKNPKPIYVVWETTMRCDHACSHCGSRAEYSRPNELETKELLDVADQLIRIGTREVTLIGGEAYLRSDVYKLVEYLSNAGIYVAMQTGGLGLTDRRIEKLRKAGLRGIGVSIDGPADVHDVLRDRKGSWAAGMSSIRRASQAGFNVTSNTQVNQLTKDRLRETAYALKEAGVKVWRIQLTVPMGRAADRPEWLLQPWQILEVMDDLAAIKTQKSELEAELSTIKSERDSLETELAAKRAESTEMEDRLAALKAVIGVLIIGAFKCSK